MGWVVRRGAEARQKAIEILKSGGTIAEAAEVTGYGKDYVRQLGAAEGIRFPKNKKISLTPKIIELYNQGLKPKEIASEIGCSNLTIVYQVLHEHGINKQKVKKITAYQMRFCKECNTAFLCHPGSNKVFCSNECNSRWNHKKHDIIRRSRRNDVLVDEDISLKKLCERDKGICYLCGKPIDWDDYKVINGKKFASRMYPSIDHVIPISKGGTHSWGNIKLAHFACNASKGVSMVG